jgi:hypothetical protein
MSDEQPEQLVRAAWLTPEEIDVLRDALGGSSAAPELVQQVDRELNRARHRPGVFIVGARTTVER